MFSIVSMQYNQALLRALSNVELVDSEILEEVIPYLGGNDASLLQDELRHVLDMLPLDVLEIIASLPYSRYLPFMPT
jgi:hypothetical protein